MPKRPKPVVLIVLDGWGVAPPGDGNAIAQAKKPVLDKLIATYPAMVLKASSKEVGLGFGEMGNSEVGHLTLGSGRIMFQNLPRIFNAINNGTFETNEAFLCAIEQVKKNNSHLHLVGLCSPGGVHAHLAHLLALLDLAKAKKIKEVFIHVILDGRDTLPNVAADFVEEIQKKIKTLGLGKIATISGRFYAMDRDNHWERVEKVYRAMVDGVSDKTFDNPLNAIASSYEQKIFDENFVPVVITENDTPVAKVADGDAVIFFNFRSDRSRQLTKAFVLPEFDKFARKYFPNLFFVTMMEYERDLPVEVAFGPEAVNNPLAQVIADAGLKQLHIAETEKYAHVTFFFNGLKDVKFSGEDQVVIPSPRVASYDTEPQMSAGVVTERVIKEIKADKYDFILVNFANADMVGHTGTMPAIISAIEFTDHCVGQIVDVALLKGGAVIVTADHGNAEDKINLQTGERLTDHSTNPVPCLVIGKTWEGQTAGLPEGLGGDLSLVPPGGILSDVAPTILKIMNLKQPPEMTGMPLI